GSPWSGSPGRRPWCSPTGSSSTGRGGPMGAGTTVLLVVVLLFVLLVVVSVVKAVQIIPQAQAAVIERLGRYQRTLTPGLAFLVPLDRKSTRLNSSHSQISYAVFCLKKKKKK